MLGYFGSGLGTGSGHIPPVRKIQARQQGQIDVQIDHMKYQDYLKIVEDTPKEELAMLLMNYRRTYISIMNDLRKAKAELN